MRAVKIRNNRRQPRKHEESSASDYCRQTTQSQKPRSSTWIVEDCLCRLYDRNDGLFLVMWLISISSPKELIQIAEYFRLHWRQRLRAAIAFLIVKAQFPAVVMITPKAGEVNKRPNIEELKKRMEQSRLRKLRGDLDQLIESDPKLRALRPHLKIDLVRKVYVFRSSIARIARCLELAVPTSNPICATFCAPSRPY